jgi:DNA repair exonuclease SbcCD ATPase subunit
MHPLEKDIITILQQLQSITEDVITALTNAEQEQEVSNEQLQKAQQQLDSRSKLLDQFESKAQQLRQIDESEHDQLTGGPAIQEHYDQLMERDAEMQKSISRYMVQMEKQVRTNKKELDASGKYNDQKNGSVDNSMFITSKLEG